MLEAIKSEVEKLRKRHILGRMLWSGTYYTTVFGAAVLSLVVASISPTEIEISAFGLPKDVWISVLSLTAAILAAVSAKGGFERKWIANRITSGRLYALELDLLDPRADAVEAKETLKKILEDHDKGIIGRES